MPMLEKDPVMPWISPMLVVKDVDESLQRYAEAFGLEPGETMQEEGRTTYASMMYKGQMILMLMPEKSWGSPSVTPVSSETPTPVNLYIYVDNVDEQFKKAQQVGLSVISEPEDMFWGDRVTRMQDADGHTWSVATRVADYQQLHSATA